MTAIEEEVRELKKRVAQLEARVFQGGEDAEPEQLPVEDVMDRHRLRAWLKAQGVAVELPPAAQEEARRWREMTDAEKQKHIRAMRELQLDPPLSQIILESRR